jgi:hypothetical protein
MSWNETFYWLAILSFSLALAQLGISNISPAFYEAIFGHKPNNRMSEIMRKVPNFLGVLSIIALVLAFAAGLRLIIGFGEDLGIFIAEHLGYLDNTTLMLFTWIISSTIMIVIAFWGLRAIWRFAAKLPSRNLDTQQDTKTINVIIQQHLKEIREGNAKTKEKNHNKK